jgi:hypothetical protein
MACSNGVLNLFLVIHCIDLVFFINAWNVVFALPNFDMSCLLVFTRCLGNVLMFIFLK